MTELLGSASSHSRCWAMTRALGNVSLTAGTPKPPEASSPASRRGAPAASAAGVVKVAGGHDRHLNLVAPAAGAGQRGLDVLLPRPKMSFIFASSLSPLPASMSACADGRAGRPARSSSRQLWARATRPGRHRGATGSRHARDAAEQAAAVQEELARTQEGPSVADVGGCGHDGLRRFADQVSHDSALSPANGPYHHDTGPAESPIDLIADSAGAARSGARPASCNLAAASALPGPGPGRGRTDRRIGVPAISRSRLPRRCTPAPSSAAVAPPPPIARRPPAADAPASGAGPVFVGLG